MRPTHVLFVVVVAVVVYRLAPETRREEWRGKAREFGRALVLALVMFWGWMFLARMWRG